MRPVTTLVFDLDDTLFPEADYARSGFQAVEKFLWAKQGAAGFAKEASALFAAGHRGRIFDEVLPRLGIAPTAALVADLVRVYREHPPAIPLFPDAHELLTWATGRFNLALITDGYTCAQEQKVAALDLERRIPCRILTDRLGREYWKPSPEPFRRVMAFYPGAAEEFVYVADNPRKDFIGARTLGWRTVRVRRAGTEHFAYEPQPHEAAETEFASLAEVKTWLAPTM